MSQNDPYFDHSGHRIIQTNSVQYTLLDEIGHGSFATVYKAVGSSQSSNGAPMPTAHNNVVAIKAISKSKIKENKKHYENMISEIQILQKSSHENIVGLYDIIEKEKEIFLVMEYCSLGDLSHFIRSIRSKNSKTSVGPWGGLPEVLIRDFVRQFGSAFHFLRSQSLIHRDLKPQNVLICPSPLHSDSEIPILKLGDFGFARVLPHTFLATTMCGSPLYMAPEILKGEKYDATADLWSLGTILYEMMYGTTLFKAQNHIQLGKMQDAFDTVQFPDDRTSLISPDSRTSNVGLRGKRGSRSSESQVSLPPAPDDIKDLIRRLLKTDPRQRMSFEAFFNHACVSYESTGVQEETTTRNRSYSYPSQQHIETPFDSYSSNPTSTRKKRAMTLADTQHPSSYSPRLPTQFYPASVEEPFPPMNDPLQNQMAGLNIYDSINVQSRGGKSNLPVAKLDDSSEFVMIQKEPTRVNFYADTVAKVAIQQQQSQQPVIRTSTQRLRHLMKGPSGSSPTYGSSPSSPLAAIATTPDSPQTISLSRQDSSVSGTSSGRTSIRTPPLPQVTLGTSPASGIPHLTGGVGSILGALQHQNSSTGSLLRTSSMKRTFSDSIYKARTPRTQRQPSQPTMEPSLGSGIGRTSTELSLTGTPPRLSDPPIRLNLASSQTLTTSNAGRQFTNLPWYPTAQDISVLNEQQAFFCESLNVIALQAHAVHSISNNRLELYLGLLTKKDSKIFQAFEQLDSTSKSTTSVTTPSGTPGSTTGSMAALFADMTHVPMDHPSLGTVADFLSTEQGNSIEVCFEEMLVMYGRSLSLYQYAFSTAMRLWEDEQRGMTGSAGTVMPGNARAPTSLSTWFGNMTSSVVLSNRQGNDDSETASYHVQAKRIQTLNILIQWIREGFNECLQKAEWIRAVLSQVEQRHLDASHPVSQYIVPRQVETILFEEALKLAQAAATLESLKRDLDRAEFEYHQALLLLESLLYSPSVFSHEREEDVNSEAQNEDGLVESDRIRVESLVRKLVERRNKLLSLLLT